MIVHVSSILHEYTGGRPQLEASGRTLSAVLHDLDRAHPGLKFRIVDEQDHIRPHIRIFVGEEQVRDLKKSVGAADEVHILGALSGG